MRIAFVVQRYGREVNGGAEVFCRMMAEHLVRRAEVSRLTVFTTCARDHTTWANHYRAGVEERDGVSIERFPVLLRRFRPLQALLGRIILPIVPIAALEHLWFLAQGPLAPRLLGRLAEVRDRYDVFVFFTYLYYSTIFGLPVVRERAVLVPTAHDEPTVRMKMVRRLFGLPRAFVFLSPEERELVVSLGGGGRRSATVGSGIEIPSPGVAAEGDREPDGGWDGSGRLGIGDGPFLLYLGRIERRKGVRELFRDFRAFKHRHRDTILKRRDGRPYPGSELRLVLAGRAALSVPRAPDVIALGFVSDEEKALLLARAEALVLPSRFESLSLVVLEAWAAGTPVIVNGECAVTRGLTARAGGGVAYTDAGRAGHAGEGFDHVLADLLADPALRRRLAEAGNRYVTENMSWEQVENRFLGLLADAAAEIAGDRGPAARDTGAGTAAGRGGADGGASS
jgi:glycosyltransferase involved in cell wall biosynthesis